MKSFDKYKNYSEADFASDIDFITWVKFADESSNLFWNRFVEIYPNQKLAVQKAVTIVNAMKVDSDNRNDHAADIVWQRIIDEIHQQVQFKQQKQFKIIRVSLMAAASVVLLLVLSYFLFLKNNSDTKNTNIQISKTDVLPGGNKAVLTLADGSTIILDSAMDGTLSTQGSVKVIKLDDGKLAYQDANTSGTASAMTYNTISTPRGGQYKLVLSDGTAVWLNAASSLRFPTSFNGNERRVELTGEGYFEVTKNAAMPFKVLVDDMEVKVLGTHFNVNAYSDENDIKTTLLEGQVIVTNGREEAILKPGQQVQLLTDGRLKKINKVDLYECE